MSNTRTGILIGSGVATGVAVMGVALIYAAKTRSRNRSLLERTRKQASKLRDAAADGLAEAVEAGKVAYQRVAG